MLFLNMFIYNDVVDMFASGSQQDSANAGNLAANAGKTVPTVAGWQQHGSRRGVQQPMVSPEPIMTHNDWLVVWNMPFIFPY